MASEAPATVVATSPFSVPVSPALLISHFLLPESSDPEARDTHRHLLNTDTCVGERTPRGAPLEG